MFCNLDDLKTESDVEQKLLWPLLTSVPPRGLGYTPAEVMTKASIRRLEIGKGESRHLYYPDYVVLLSGVPLMVVEAKVPTDKIDRALDEARMYAAKLNELFPSGLNPCSWVVGCNGHEFIVGKWDTTEVSHSLNFSDINLASTAFANVLKALQRESLSPDADAFRRRTTKRPFWRPVSEMGGNSVRNEEIGHNTFGSTLALDFRHLFNPSTAVDRAYLVKNAYIQSKRRERYIEPIHRLIRDVALPSVSHIPILEDSERPREVVQMLRRGSVLEHQIMLLVGSVGSGKSTFVDYLVNVALPAELLEKTTWLRLDLNVAPLTRESAQAWMIEQIIKELHASAVGQDFDDPATINAVYGVEIKRFRKLALGFLSEDSQEYKVRLIDEIRTLQKDRIGTAKALARHMCAERAKLLIVVLDNCDKRSRDDQLLMFQLAQWVQSELRCLMVLPLRDVTYDLNRGEPPLDTAQKDLVFRIEPPQFTKVLSGRVRLALKELEARGGEQFEYALGNGIRVTYPSSDQGMYLASILRSLYEHDTFLRRIMSGLAGRDIRRALEIFLEFCQSGYISEGEILQIRRAQGNYPLPLPVVASVLLRSNRRFYDGDASYVKNLFQANPTDAVPDHFVRLAVLRFLETRRDTKGPSGAKGFHPVSDVLATLAAIGHAVERVRAEVAYLLQHGCITAEHQRTDAVADSDLITLAAPGAVHLEMLDSVYYLAACAEDTWTSDRSMVERVCSRIGKTRLAHLAETTVVANAREFVDYLGGANGRWPAEAKAFVDCPAREDLHRLEIATEAIGAAEEQLRRRAKSGRLFVGNLPYDATREEVAELFGEQGIDALEVTIPMANGQSKGFAFVGVGDADSVELAIRRLDGRPLHGRPLAVQLANDRKR
jgi:hypothetical protein